MLIFGERLKKLRTSRNMTQDELGLIFESPKAQSTIGTWERGNREPSMTDLIKIATYFKVSTDYLLGLTDEIVDTNRESKELKDFLLSNEVLFNGSELSSEEKQRIIDILTGLFWDNFTNKN